MTEKRSDYRKRQSKKKDRTLFDSVKAAFTDQKDKTEDVDVNQGFKREPEEENYFSDEDQRILTHQSENSQLNQEDKSLRLKKRLNHAILLVFVLILLVLLALFHL